MNPLSKRSRAATGRGRRQTPEASPAFFSDGAPRSDEGCQMQEDFYRPTPASRPLVAAWVIGLALFWAVMGWIIIGDGS